MAAAPCLARARVSASIGNPGRGAYADGACTEAPSRNCAGTAAWIFTADTAGAAGTGPCAVMMPAALVSAADGVPMPPRPLLAKGMPSGAATSHFRRLRPSAILAELLLPPLRLRSARVKNPHARNAFTGLSWTPKPLRGLALTSCAPPNPKNIKLRPSGGRGLHGQASVNGSCRER